MESTMAKKPTSAVKKTSKAQSTAPAVQARSAATSAPAKPARPRSITHEMIAKRAYEIYVSGRGGTADENWRRAENELRA
jgi:hypothetical protein